MTDYLRVHVELSIPEGKIDEFKRMSDEIVGTVEANEPNTFTYEWYISDDNKKCNVVETFKDSEAMMAHLGDVGESLGKLSEIAQLTGMMVYGHASDELRQALDPFRPEIFERWTGVSRLN